MKISEFASLLFQTFIKWQKHDATLRAAALTFFTIIPLPSLVLITVAVLAQIYGGPQAFQNFINQISTVVGPAVADVLSQVLLDARSPLTSVFGSFLAIIFAIAGGIGAFLVLQKSIDIIWEIKVEQRGRTSFIKEKLLPFGLIAIIGIIVVAVDAITTILFGTIVFFLNPILGDWTSFLLKALQVIVSFGLGILLFAIIFKMLPETIVKWRDVWLASLLTAIVFTALNYLFGLYLSIAHISTLAGTAGSLMVLLLWVYFTNLFILFGAQFSRVYAQTHGSLKNIKPVPKRPPIPRVDRVEVTAEVEVKVKEEKNL